MCPCPAAPGYVEREYLPEYKSPTHLGLGGLVEPGECLQHVEDEHVAAKLEAELAQGRGHRPHDLELVSEIEMRLRIENMVVDRISQLI